MPKQRKSHTPYPMAWWMIFRMPKSFEIETPLPIEEVADRLYAVFDERKTFFKPYTDKSIQGELLDDDSLSITLTDTGESSKTFTGVTVNAVIQDYDDSTRLLGIIYLSQSVLPYLLWFFGVASLIYWLVLRHILVGPIGMVVVVGCYIFLFGVSVFIPIFVYREMRDEFPDRLQQILADGRKASK